jgi:glycosyltransferase involved in cell wall biosynthesis
LLEAMACAIPCIGSALDGTAEALREGQLGLVIDPTNREALREAIEASLRKPKLVPPGLEYFSSEQFHARARAVLSQILADEIAA